MSSTEELANQLWTSLGFAGNPPKKSATRLVCAALGFNYDEQTEKYQAERTDEAKQRYYASEECRRSGGPRIWGSTDMVLWLNLSFQLRIAISISTKTKTMVIDGCPILSDLQTIVVGYLVCNELDQIANFMNAADRYIDDYVDVRDITSDDAALRGAARDYIHEAIAINLLLRKSVIYENQEELQMALTRTIHQTSGSCIVTHLSDHHLSQIVERALQTIGRSIIPHSFSYNLVF